MAEPPIPATVHGGAPASLNSVFIDTNLDTHLAVMVSSSDTIADLKKKILEEHLLCFPKLGEIKLDGLKLKRRGSYYYLAESMLLGCAFDVVKKGWFVRVEASIVSKGKETEPEEANLALMITSNGLEEEGVNVVLDGRRDVMPERDLLVSQKESNELLVEVAREGQLVGGDDCVDKVSSMVQLVSDEFVREEKCDEEEAQEMDVERAEIGKELSKIDASSVLPEGASDVKEKCKKRKRSKKGADDSGAISVLPEGASDVKEKRKKRKRSEKGADDLSGKDVDVSMHKLGAKGGEEEIKVLKTTASQERSEVNIGDMQIIVSERDLLVSQKESNELLVEVARGDQLVGGDDCGDKVLSTVPLVSDEFVREEKCDEEEAQEMDVERAENGKELSKIDASSVLPEGASDVKEKRKKRNRSKKGVDDLSGKDVDVSMQKLGAKGGEEEIKLSETTALQERTEVDNGDMRIIVSESNAMTSEPPLSQLPTIDEQLANSTLEAPNADSAEAVDQLASQSLGKKKRKTKSFKKVDKENVGVTPGEANAGEEVPLKEAGINSGNVAEEPPPSDAHMTQPSAVSLTEKDPNPLQEQQNNFPSQDINEFQEPTTNDMNIVETEQEVPKTVSTKVHKEVVGSISCEVDPHVDDGKSSKKRKKSRKHKVLTSGTVQIPSDADHVKDYYDVPEKVDKAENSIREATEKGDVKEAAAADSLRASLLVTDKEIDEVIKNVVESAQQTTKSETVAENKEGKSRKKTMKKHGSDCKNSVPLTQAEAKCTDENIPAPSTANIHCTDSSRFPYNANPQNPGVKNSLDRAEIRSPPEKVGGDAENASEVDGVDFSSYFIPREQNKKSADPSEVTGAWTKTKSKKKREVQEGNLHDISPMLPEHPTLKEKLEAHAKPQEKKAEPSSGIVDKRKRHGEEAKESNAPTRPIGGKPKKRIEQHHSESSTNSTSHTRRGKGDQSQSQQTRVNGGRGYNAHPGEVVNGMVHPKPVVASRSLFKQNPFDDDSDDSLEPYHFPSPLNQPHASSPESDSDLSVSSVHSDVETDAGLDSIKRNGSSGRKGMMTPFSSGIPLDTILKNSKRYKKAKLDAESQPEDFIVPLSPSTSK